MATTISTAPPTRALSLNPLYVRLQSDQVSPQSAYFEIQISGAGPTTGQSITLTWPGDSITYTVGPLSESGANWPPKESLESLATYADRIADFLHHVERVQTTFRVSREADAGSAKVVRLTRRVPEPYDLGVSGTLTGVAITANDATTAAMPDTLRGLVQVWRSTGAYATDELLVSLHSPYRIAGYTEIDISAAFAGLKAHLPPESTINPSAVPGSLPYGEASDMLLDYYLRYADKSGTPAVAQALLRTNAVYQAVLGARATDSTSTDWPLVRHNYRRLDGQVFEKPVAQEQPDYVYWHNRDAEAVEVFVSVKVYWSDGTSSVHTPWGTTPVAVSAERLYWFPSGFRQLGLHLVAPSGSTDSGAYITAYDWRLGPADEDDTFYLATVRYRLLFDSNWQHFLLFDNGFGGLESVWLRGKATHLQANSAATAERPAQFSDNDRDQPMRARTVTYAQSGRREWQCSTGFLDETYYLTHLQQVPLGSGAWLIDTERKRFLPVTVEARQLVTNKDDETLLSAEFTLRAAWVDDGYNH